MDLTVKPSEGTELTPGGIIYIIIEKADPFNGTRAGICFRNLSKNTEKHLFRQMPQSLKTSVDTSFPVSYHKSYG